jgi:hypothetical protein
MTQLHTIFNDDHPTCLYCKGDCDVSGFGEAMAVVDTYTCRQCKESFEIFSIGEVKGFTFSCNGISVHQNYELKQFGLKRKGPDDWKSSLVWIPEFEIDFSEKEKLHRLLMTCLIFS